MKIFIRIGKRRERVSTKVFDKLNNSFYDSSMQFLLIANTIFEGAIGFLMIFMPETLFLNANELSLALARTFGFAAIAISMLSLIIYSSSERREVLLGGYTSLALFHSGLTLAQAINFFQGFTSFPIVVAHGTFAVLFVLSAIQIMYKHR